jgi:ATP-dependent DNA ligase
MATISGSCPAHAQDEPTAPARSAARGHLLAEFERGEIGADLFRAACRMGFERLVSKHRERPYQARWSRHRVKVKNRTHPAMERVLDELR